MFRRGWLVLGTLVLLFGGASRVSGGGKVFVFAFLNEQGAQSAAEARNAFMNMLAAAKRQGDLKFEFKALVVNGREELRKMIEMKQVHLVYASSRDFYVESVLKYKVKPFIQILHNGKPNIKNCLYVLSASPFKDIKSLKGTKALTYDSLDMYYGLRTLVGQRPEIFFNPLSISPNGVSSAYAVSLGGAKAALIGDWTIEALMATNPGPVRKIRSVGCMAPLMNAPVFSVAPMDPVSAKETIQTLLRLQDSKNPTDPALRNVLRFLNLFKLRFAPAKESDYQSMVQLFVQNQKKGFKSDYDSWYQYANRDRGGTK